MTDISVTTGGPVAPADAILGETILSVIQEAAPALAIATPAAVYGADDATAIELASLANEIAQRIAFEAADWQTLRAIATITGDGTTDNFALPDDYRRMLKDTRLWPSWMKGVSLEHIDDTDRWLERQVLNFQPTIGAWTILANRLYIRPAVPSGATVQFAYITNNVVKGTDKIAFDDDGDIFALDARVLKLGIIWQWRATKGQPYAEAMATYETALAEAVGRDRGPRTMAVGRPRLSRLADRVAWPGTITLG